MSSNLWQNPGRGFMSRQYFASNPCATQALASLSVAEKEIRAAAYDAAPEGETVDPQFVFVLGHGFQALPTGDDDALERQAALLVAFNMPTETNEDGELLPLVGPTYFWVPKASVDLDLEWLPSDSPADSLASSMPAATPATTLLPTLKAHAVTLDYQFTPGVHDAALWGVDITQQLAINNWDGQSEAQRVNAALLTLHADTMCAAITDGARDMDLATLITHLVSRYPCSSSGASRRREITDRRATNQDDSISFSDKMVSDWVRSYNLKTLAELKVSQSADHFTETMQSLGAALLRALCPEAQVALRLQRAALMDGCKSVAKLNDLRALIVTEQSARCDAAAKPRTHVGAYTINANKGDLDTMATMTAQIEKLQAALRAKESSGTEDRRDRRPFAFDPDKGRACRHCEDQPISVNGKPAGQHWDSQCPNRPPRKNDG